MFSRSNHADIMGSDGGDDTWRVEDDHAATVTQETTNHYDHNIHMTQYLVT